MAKIAGIPAASKRPIWRLFGGHYFGLIILAVVELVIIIDYNENMK